MQDPSPIKIKSYAKPIAVPPKRESPDLTPRLDDDDSHN